MKVRGDRCAGALYGLIGAPNDLARKPGEWNQVRILLEPAGDNKCRLRFWLNSRQTVDIVVDPGPDSEWSKLLGNAHSKDHFAKDFFKAKTGYILLQDHGARVAFRNIRIRTIDDSGIGKGAAHEIRHSYCTLDKALEKEPGEFGLKRNRWDGILVVEYLRRAHGVRLKVREAQRWIRRLGFSMRKPIYRYVQARPEGVEEFRDTVKKSPGRKEKQRKADVAVL